MTNIHGDKRQALQAPLPSPSLTCASTFTCASTHKHTHTHPQTHTSTIQQNLQTHKNQHTHIQATHPHFIHELAFKVVSKHNQDQRTQNAHLLPIIKRTNTQNRDLLLKPTRAFYKIQYAQKLDRLQQLN